MGGLYSKRHELRVHAIRPHVQEGDRGTSSTSGRAGSSRNAGTSGNDRGNPRTGNDPGTRQSNKKK